jgi:hypothetical protein
LLCTKLTKKYLPSFFFKIKLSKNAKYVTVEKKISIFSEDRNPKITYLCKNLQNFLRKNSQ